ncbi:MAG TPA: sterol desaturase family protein [Candidatus Limnocylindria bacterium]|nr:sterol desaturase family protein [Candidatus Limnocylindria bacterium]
MTGAAELAHWRGFASIGWLAVLLLWETASPFFTLFHGWQERGLHAVRNVTVGLLNGLCTALLFAVAWKWVADFTAAHHFGLLHLVLLPSWAHAVLALLLLDLWTYWWHRVCHLVPLLWRFHRVHHSDPQMDVTTANRFHLGEIILSSLLRLPLLALLGIHFGELVLYETLLQVVVQWQHANIGLPPTLDRLLGSLVVTPGMHKVHHSREQPETDSNFASLLPVWDLLFGSRRWRSDPEHIRLGLDGLDGAAHQKLCGLLREPFRPDGGS